MRRNRCFSSTSRSPVHRFALVGGVKTGAFVWGGAVCVGEGWEIAAIELKQANARIREMRISGRLNIGYFPLTLCTNVFLHITEAVLLLLEMDLQAAITDGFMNKGRKSNGTGESI